MEDKYKRVTQAQFDLWIDNPVTKTYLQCLEWSAEQIAESLGKGSNVDSSNNDLSMNIIHSRLGEKVGLLKAANPIDQFITHEMLEDKEIQE